MPLSCPECSSDDFKITFVDFDYSAESGIQGLVLQSARRYDCQGCGNVLIEVGKLAEIDRELAMRIAQIKTRNLNGAELKFVRRRHFKMTIDELSARFGVDTATLSVTEEHGLELNERVSDLIRLALVEEFVSQKESIKVVLGDEEIKLDPKRKARG